MSYVGPVPENTCSPGQAQTFTEELGRHCVDLVVQHVDKLAVTGQADPGWLPLAGVAALVVGWIFLAWDLRDQK